MSPILPRLRAEANFMPTKPAKTIPAYLGTLLAANGYNVNPPRFRPAYVTTEPVVKN